MIDLDPWVFAVGDRVRLKARPRCMGTIVEIATDGSLLFRVAVDPCGNDRGYSISCIAQDLKPVGHYYAAITVTYNGDHQWSFNAKTLQEIDEWIRWGMKKSEHETMTLDLGQAVCILSWEGLQTVQITRKQWTGGEDEIDEQSCCSEGAKEV